MIPNNQQQQPSYKEVFIPPRASIVNYFMAKVRSSLDLPWKDGRVILGVIG